MNKTDIAHLRFLADTQWGQRHLTEFLYHPDAGLWCSVSAGQFSAAFEAIRRQLDRNDQVLRFLELHILTEALLQKENSPEWMIPWVADHLNVADYVKPLDWQTCLGGQWHAVPVFLVHEKAYLRYFILGLISRPTESPSWPEWADGLLDETAKRGILSAVKACARIRSFAPNQGTFCYPLTVPSQNLQVKDASLGLPLSLGFMALLSGRKLPEDLAASASVQEDGSLRKVGQLSKKISYAEKAGFRVFLFCADNRVSSKREDMELLPVSSLAEAWMAACLYAPGQAGKLLMMATMLNDPQAFANNCAVAPVEWLAWALRNNRTRQVMGLMLKSPIDFETYIQKLGMCLDKGEIARAEILARLLESASSETLAGAAPLSLFKWFTLNLSMANHRGDVSASDRWEKEAEAIVRQASVSDMEAFASFYNHRFIAVHHNRYYFNPELPSFIKEILASLEAQYQCQRQLVETAANKTLGALYGSIAQNYGFCGPSCLKETERYLILSQKAFGDGRTPEWRGDWLRQFNYLTYASLDAGDVDAAKKALLAYLEIDDWQELWPKLPGLTQWRHAALARFLADSRKREKAAIYAEWAVSNSGQIREDRHPWQLWLHNMGRIMDLLGDRQSALNYYDCSLTVCRSGKLGPTVQAMALLPLSGLWQTEGLNRVDLVSVEKEIRRAANDLNPVHFSPFLNEPDFIKTLENVWTRPEKMFPFTYR
jgi:hypothetical protein